MPFPLYSIHLLGSQVFAAISILFLSSLCESSLASAGLIKVRLCRYTTEETVATRKNCSHLSGVAGRQCCAGHSQNCSCGIFSISHASRSKSCFSYIYSPASLLRGRLPCGRLVSSVDLWPFSTEHFILFFNKRCIVCPPIFVVILTCVCSLLAFKFLRTLH